MEEIWVKYKENYEVSNLGKIKHLKLNRITSGTKGINYLLININGKTKPVHQVVAECFLNHTPCGLKIVVDHIDNNKLNNRVDNLQLISHRENTSKDRENKLGLNGVAICKNKFIAQINYNGKKIHLGLFNNKEDANKSYINACNSIKYNKKIIIKNGRTAKFKSIYKYVYWCENKWRVIINKKHFGYFNTELEAFNYINTLSK